MNFWFKFDQGQEKGIGGVARFQGMGRALTYLIALFLLAGLLPGCGPTHEEIMAQDQERLRREIQARQEAEARRQAEQAKEERIQATVMACSDLAAQGQLEQALIRCQEALRDIDRYSNQDQQVREMIIKVARAMPAPPPVPEQTLRSMARGEAKVKMGGAGAYEGAAKEMEQAVLAAPWLADAYFNLGIVQEKGDMFGKAIQNFRLYLIAVPDSRNAKAIQAKIYELEVMREEQEKLQALAGSWRGNGGVIYKVQIEGRKIRVAGTASIDLKGNVGVLNIWRVFDLEKKGDSLEGSASVAWQPSHECTFPAETVPTSGVIRGDGNSMQLAWKETVYNWTWRGSVCTGVSSTGKYDFSLQLTERVSPGVAPSYSEIKPSSTSGKKMKMKK